MSSSYRTHLTLRPVQAGRAKAMLMPGWSESLTVDEAVLDVDVGASLEVELTLDEEDVVTGAVL